MKILFLLWVFTPFGIYSIARKQQAPCDESNRFNKLILLWFAFTRYDDLLKFIKVSKFKMIWLATTKEQTFYNSMPWLGSDMWERLNADSKK